MPLSKLLLAGKNASMTSFFSVAFVVAFLPISILGYAITPQKYKKYFLLFASFAFFWLVSGTLTVYLIATVILMHYFGLWLDRVRKKMKAVLDETEKERKKEVKKHYINQQRLIIWFAVVIQIGILLVLKYSGFFNTNINSLLSLMGSEIVLDIPKYLMPIGISFFSLQALSYILDVYNGVTEADDNIFRIALFISFFPQIVEGPICRYNQTAQQLWDAKQITYSNLTLGMQRFLFGMMKKMVVADRLDPFVNYIFSEYANLQGGMAAIGAVCYTIQLYMDFSGSMDAVLGVAQIFGIELPENFKRPFFSKTISEFWKRWHITLGTWFRDYLFYPVTTSDKMKKLTSSARKKLGNHYGPLIAGSIALFCVWISNGLWHGSDWNYVFYGMYHLFLILLGNIIAPLVKSVNRKLHINSESFVYRVLQIIRTTVLVVIGELFFRADGLKNGFAMFGKMVSDFSFSGINSEFLVKCKIDVYDFLIVFVTLAIVFVISLLNEKGISVRNELEKKNIAVRWLVLYALIMYIIVFGAYGYGYDPVDPLYAQF